MAYYDDLRAEIAAMIEPHIAENDWADGLHRTLAERILRIKAIAIPLANAMPDMTDEQIANCFAAIREQGEEFNRR